MGLYSSEYSSSSATRQAAWIGRCKLKVGRGWRGTPGLHQEYWVNITYQRFICDVMDTHHKRRERTLTIRQIAEHLRMYSWRRVNNELYFVIKVKNKPG